MLKLKQKVVLWAKSSLWFYPVILLVLLLTLTTFKISGTSEGVYHTLLYGDQSKDPDLLAGIPKHVRADEWLVITQMTVAQSQNGYKKYNPNFGTGRDLALQVEIPYKDWSAVFRPHTWGYFVFGLERGFAFRWWQPMFLLLIGVYFFCLQVFPNKKLLASLISLSVGLSPFLLWWYQTAAIGTIAYALFAMILVRRILDGAKTRYVKSPVLSSALHVVGLGFVLACFELLLYPPFQIPVAIVVLFYSLGYLAKKIFDDKLSRAIIARRVGLLAIGLAFAAVVGLVFVEINKVPIQALNDTLYPGKRLTHSGGLNWMYMFNGYLMPLQETGFSFFRNLSESSNFILTLPFLLIPGYLLIIYEYIKKRYIDWVFLAIQLCGTMFLLRAFVHFGNSFYQLLLLNRVPNVRMLIGLGFVGILQYILILNKLSKSKIKANRYRQLAAGFGLISAAVLVATIIYLGGRHRLHFQYQWLLLIFSAVWFWLIIVAALIKKPLVAALLLFGFSLFSSFYTLPLYRGLGFVDNGRLVQAIRQVSKPGDSWITLDTVEYDNIALAAGRRSYSGEQIYADKSFWAQVGGEKFERAYNRKADARFVTKHTPADIFLVKANLFEIRFYCSDFILKKVNYALSTKPINYKCTNLVDTVKYPKVTFYLYKLHR